MVKTLLGILLSFSLQGSVTINELIERSLTQPTQSIDIKAEAIGEVLERGEYAWVNVNDGSNAIGVYVPIYLTENIEYFGDYDHKGDTLRIVGTFNRACVEHGGEMDIHATQMFVVVDGYDTPHPLELWKIILTIGLFGLAMFSLYLGRDYLKNRKLRAVE
ncbi:MAG: hypothetical protein WCI62_01410 [Erysipelotrichaceae bacterium]